MRHHLTLSLAAAFAAALGVGVAAPATAASDAPIYSGEYRVLADTWIYEDVDGTINPAPLDRLDAGEVIKVYGQDTVAGFFRITSFVRDGKRITVTSDVHADPDYVTGAVLTSVDLRPGWRWGSD